LIQEVIEQVLMTQYFDLGLKLEVKSVWGCVLPQLLSSKNHM